MPKLYGILASDGLTGAEPKHRVAAKYRLDFSNYRPRHQLQLGTLRELSPPLVSVQPHCICGVTLARRLGLQPVFQTPIKVNYYNGRPKNFRNIYHSIDRATVMASQHVLHDVRFTEPREISTRNNDGYVEISRLLDLTIYVVPEIPQLIIPRNDRRLLATSVVIPGDYFCLGYDFGVRHFHDHPLIDFEIPHWATIKSYPFVRARAVVPVFCGGRFDPDQIPIAVA